MGLKPDSFLLLYIYIGEKFIWKILSLIKMKKSETIKKIVSLKKDFFGALKGVGKMTEADELQTHE